MAAGAVVVMLWLLGVQMTYVFGIVTFVLSFVPNFRPLIATALPMPFIIFDPAEENAIKGNAISILTGLYCMVVVGKGRRGGM